MHATHRLFSIIQALRTAKHPVTAKQLSETLEVSQRTIYRDILELQSQHVPIEGEAGIGYVLRKGFDMPPLMLTVTELEAAALGALWVTERGDPSLAAGAQSLLAKIKDVLPDHLHTAFTNSPNVVPNWKPVVHDALDMKKVREWIRNQQKLVIHYQNEKGEPSTRIIWPFMVAYFETVRLVVAWCETREDFRHFRTDRIAKIDFLSDKFPKSIKQLKREWKSKETNSDNC